MVEKFRHGSHEPVGILLAETKRTLVFRRVVVGFVVVAVDGIAFKAQPVLYSKIWFPSGVQHTARV